MAASHGHLEGLESEIDEIMEEMTKREFGTSAYFGELDKGQGRKNGRGQGCCETTLPKIIEPGGLNLKRVG